MAEHVDQVVTPDGCALALQVTGAGDPVLLLAGQANNHRWWDRQRPDFDRAHTVITFDYRGTGGSDDAASGWSTREFAADALAVLDHLGVDRCAVYGTSLGGRVAQWLAVLAPDRVTRLALGCTTPGGEHAVERDDAVRRALAVPAAQAREVTADLFYTPRWRASHPGPYTTLGDASASRRAKAGHLRASTEHDAWDVLPQIACPTLILHGSDDRLAPVVNAELIASRVPDARVVTFAGARHGYFDECAPEATALVLDHLAR